MPANAAVSGDGAPRRSVVLSRLGDTVCIAAEAAAVEDDKNRPTPPGLVKKEVPLSERLYSLGTGVTRRLGRTHPFIS